jgi:hypothetical protein
MTCGLFLWAPASDPNAVASVPAPRIQQPWLNLERGRSGDQPALVPAPGGGYRHEDRARGFVAHIQADGTVRFAPLARGRFSVSTGKGDWWGGAVAALQRPPGQRDRPELEYAMPLRDDASARAFATVETVPWGDYGPPPILLSVGASPSTGRTRGPGHKTKADFLRRTEAMRTTLAVQWRKKQLRAAMTRVKQRVVAIWRNDTVPFAERKRLIFELWDESEPSAAATGPLEQDTRDAAATARHQIEHTIRRLAPAGSRNAFTPEELESLNAQRRSEQAFAPY